jgi:hypothetical protein
MLCANLLFLIGVATFHPGNNAAYNNDNDVLGFQCNNVTVVHYNNSYNNETWAGSMAFPAIELTPDNSILPFDVNAGASVSLATGYSHLIDVDTQVVPMISTYVDLGPFRVHLIPGSDRPVGAVSATYSVKLRKQE